MKMKDQTNYLSISANAVSVEGSAYLNAMNALCGAVSGDILSSFEHIRSP